MPDVASAGLLAVQATSVIQSEFHGPAADGFIGDNNPALEQHFLDKAKAEREPEIEPDGVDDDLRREAMAFVAHGRLGHARLVGAKALPSR